MIRRFGFGLVLVTAFIVASACGRQVTPNPPGVGAGGIPPGYMSVKFDVNNIFNFNTYQYWIVFNTSGNGQTPLTNAQQNNWSAYSFALLVGGINGVTYARAYQLVKNANPAIPPYPQQLTTTATQLQYFPNSNGTGTEFQIVFNRNVFRGIFGSPSPSPSPSSSPTVSPTGGPTPFSNVWLFNGFVTQAGQLGNWVFVDSMGQGGATDTSFVSPQLNTNSSFDNVYYKQQDINPPSDPSAQIVSIEIANNP